jgi:hypothetical protein
LAVHHLSQSLFAIRGSWFAVRYSRIAWRPGERARELIRD